MDHHITSRISVAAKEIAKLMSEDEDMSVIERKALTVLAVCGITIEDQDKFFEEINRMDVTDRVVYNLIFKYRTSQLRVSKCCGVKSSIISGVDSEKLGMCPRCQQKCEYTVIS